MAIPDFQSLMLPVLQLAGDQREHSLQEAIESLAKRFNLSDAERKELLPSGRQTIFDNRIGWARTYLKKALLLYSPRRSYFQISERGLAVLKQGSPSINIKFLQQFPEFVEFKDKSNKSVGSLTEEASEESLQSPGEEFELAYQRIRLALATELLQTIKTCSPMFFERLVVDLLVKMGYGGTRKDAGQAIGKSGDGGIDGIIKETAWD